MKKYLAIFSFFILSSTVFASTVGGSIGGWQVVSNVANGIGAKLTATKDVMINGASKVATGTANLTPNPGNVARFMGKVGAAAVVTEAMNQILDGVDYVMDPVNNTVTYHKKDSQLTDTDIRPFHQYYYGNGFDSNNYNSAKAAAERGYLNCTTYTVISVVEWSWACSYRSHPGVTLNSRSIRNVNPSYDPDAEDNTKPITVPLSDVGSQVLDQAQDDIRVGNPASAAVALSRAVAQDMAAEAETDDVKARPIANQFEQTQVIDTNEDATGTIDTPEVVDPITGEVVKPGESSSISMKWPKACEWFPTLCLFIDWMQKDSDLGDDPDLPTKQIDPKNIDQNLININASSCPAPYPVNIPLPVFNTVYADTIDISPYCSDIARMAPVLQLLAFVLAVMIIKDI